jgi:hypothetical protein
LKIELDNEHFKYKINYLCLGNPEVSGNAEYKTYQCQPAAITFEKIFRENEDYEIKAIKYDRVEEFERKLDCEYIKLNENKGREKFKAKPEKPFG